MEIVSPQGRRWGRRIAKGGVIALAVYAAGHIVFIALFMLAFALGGEIG